MRLLSVVLCVCAVFFLFPCGVFGAEAEHCGKCEVFLGRGSDGEGVYEVMVDVSAESGLCGVLCAVRYDAERLILLSVGAECGGEAFSFVDIGGEVRFLIDGAENIGEASVNLFFGLADGACGDAEVEVLFAEAYCFADNEIEELEVEISDGVVKIGENKAGGGKGANMPALVSWEIRESGGSAVLSVSGCAGEGFFAAGVELFIVRADGRGEKMLVTKVILPFVSEGIEFLVLLGNEDFYAIIITPVAFKRNGTVRGEKTVVVD